MNDSSQQPFPRLVVGLGNPGPRYSGNRHNVGFRVVEKVAGLLKMDLVPEDPRYQATPWTGDPSVCVLLKPLTYMNLSGEAVAAWLQRHELEPVLRRILVVCDDLALPLGTLRLRGKGSSGGQNGLASVIQHLAGEDFPRLRLGIDGTEGELQPDQWSDYVLSDFPPGETGPAADMVDRAAQAVLCWLEEGPERAASRFNGPLGPAR